jgi:hypothetical protein
VNDGEDGRFPLDEAVFAGDGGWGEKCRFNKFA